MFNIVNELNALYILYMTFNVFNDVIMLHLSDKQIR